MAAGAGSDPAAMRTTAVLDGNQWVINGEKKFITNGNVAGYAVIAAITDKAAGEPWQTGQVGDTVTALE